MTLPKKLMLAYLAFGGVDAATYASGRVEIDVASAPYVGRISHASSQCTASLVGEDVILTAAHCVARMGGLLPADVFTFSLGESEGAFVAESRITKVWAGGTFPECSGETDWALARLEKPLGKEYGYLHVGASVRVQESVKTIGYPSTFRGGEVLSLDRCSVTSIGHDGEVLTNCDSAPGASGSPVIRAGTNEVVGVLFGDSDTSTAVVSTEVFSEALTRAAGGHEPRFEVNVDVPLQRYVGDTKNGLPHGDGTLRCGSVSYEGKWRKGLPNGQGTLTHRGQVFEGKWKKGLMHGEVSEYRNGRVVFSGQYFKGMRHGKGTLITDNGVRYEGDLKSGRIDGEGTMTFPSGNYYVGHFQNGDFHGTGILTYSSGARYEGEFRLDHMEGTGTYYFPNGDRYEGEFRSGEFDGQGSLLWADGVRFDGTFKNGLRDGYGHVYKGSETYRKGIWRGGEFEGP